MVTVVSCFPAHPLPLGKRVLSWSRKWFSIMGLQVREFEIAHYSRILAQVQIPGLPNQDLCHWKLVPSMKMRGSHSIMGSPHNSSSKE